MALTNIIYITAKEEGLIELSRSVGETFNIVRATLGDLQIDPASCNLILVDADIEFNQLLNLLTNIYLKFDFIDIPIVLAVKEAHAGPFRKHLPPEVSGMISKPFETKQTISSIKQILCPAGSKTCPDNLVTLFCQSLTAVIETNLNQIPIKTASYDKSNYLLYGDISASMELSGGLTGSIAVAFPHDLAILQAEKMTSCNRSELDDHIILEGVGEIINQIAGKAMTIGSLTGVVFSISLPNIKAQAGRKLDRCGSTSHQVVIFELFGQQLSLHLCLELSPKTAPQTQPQTALR